MATAGVPSNPKNCPTAHGEKLIPVNGAQNDCFAPVGSTGHHNTFCSLSAGVSKSKIFRGRWLSRRATAFS